MRKYLLTGVVMKKLFLIPFLGLMIGCSSDESVADIEPQDATTETVEQVDEPVIEQTSETILVNESQITADELGERLKESLSNLNFTWNNVEGSKRAVQDIGDVKLFLIVKSDSDALERVYVRSDKFENISNGKAKIDETVSLASEISHIMNTNVTASDYSTKIDELLLVATEKHNNEGGITHNSAVYEGIKYDFDVSDSEVTIYLEPTS